MTPIEVWSVINEIAQFDWKDLEDELDNILYEEWLREQELRELEEQEDAEREEQEWREYELLCEEEMEDATEDGYYDDF